MLPSLCKPLQNAVLRFPQQAELVMSVHGLEPSKFYTMMRRTNNNPWFRYRVQREIRDLQQLTDINYSI